MNKNNKTQHYLWPMLLSLCLFAFGSLDLSLVESDALAIEAQSRAVESDVNDADDYPAPEAHALRAPTIKPIPKLHPGQSPLIVSAAYPAKTLHGPPLSPDTSI